MLKRDITYKDFDGNPQTETYYFNLSEREMLEMQYEDEDQGWMETMQRIIKDENKSGIIAQVNKIILTAYGVKSEDGKHFDKSPELIARFKSSAAYNALFLELTQDDKAATEFIVGVFPKDLSEKVEAGMPKERPPVTILPGTGIAPLIPPTPPVGYNS